MNDNEVGYFDSQVPEPWTLLGLPLRPLSAGHIILLYRIRSPFVIPENEIKFEDLACAIFLCSMPFEDGVAALNDPQLADGLAAWMAQLLADRGSIDLSEKVGEFQQYLADGCKGPSYTSTGDGTSGDAPGIGMVIAFLMSETTLTETQILNQPWRKSLWDAALVQGCRGRLQFISGETYGAALDIGRKLMEAVKAGKLRA